MNSATTSTALVIISPIIHRCIRIFFQRCHALQFSSIGTLQHLFYLHVILTTSTSLCFCISLNNLSWMPRIPFFQLSAISSSWLSTSLTFNMYSFIYQGKANVYHPEWLLSVDVSRELWASIQACKCHPGEGYAAPGLQGESVSF